MTRKGRRAGMDRKSTAPGPSPSSRYPRNATSILTQRRSSQLLGFSSEEGGPRRRLVRLRCTRSVKLQSKPPVECCSLLLSLGVVLATLISSQRSASWSRAVEVEETEVE